MATAQLNTGNRIGPFVIKIKKTGTNTNLFVKLEGDLITFNEVSGAVAYESEVTDANGNVSTQNFALTCGQLAPCQEGPTLKEIISRDAFGLQYQFHGVRVDRVRWNVIKNSSIIDSGVSIPGSDIVDVAFTNKLSPGSHVFELSGDSCYSAVPSSLGFIVPEEDSVFNWLPNYPTFDYDADNDWYRIIRAANGSGNFLSKVTNIGTGEVIDNLQLDYPSGGLLILNNVQPGNYRVQLGTLSTDINIVEPSGNCDEGPDLLEIVSSSKTQSTFKFHGLGVEILKWFIKNSSDVIQRSGTIAPGGETVTVPYAALDAGTYDLVITGSSCTSDNSILPFTITSPVLTLGAITVKQAETGEYILTVNFSGGTPNYLLQVKTQANAVISVFPNTTGSPATLTLPQGTLPQTVKVSVMDVLNALVENNNVVLPTTEPVLNILTANNYSDSQTRTPLSLNGQTFFISNGADFNFDVEFVQSNGGLYDFVPKKLEKLVSGVWVEKDLNTISGTGSSAVGPSVSKHNLFTPRASRNILIDGVNPFKTAASWRVTFSSKRGGVNGFVYTTIQRDFTISTPPTLSGIILYQRSGSALGAAVGEILSVGSSYPKPLPQFDIATTGFNGTPFNNVVYYFRQKVGSTYVQRFTYSKNWSAAQTTIDPNEASLFKDANFANIHVSILAAENQEWQIEMVARNGTTTVASRKAEFAFTLSDAAFSNPGFEKKTVAGRDHQTIQGMDYGVQVLSTGNRKLYHPANRQSLDGKNTCYPWVYLDHVRMHPDDLTTFRSNAGLTFPDGSYCVTIMWFSNVVSSYDDIITGGGAGNAYNLAGDVTKTINTGQIPDTVEFSIIS